MDYHAFIATRRQFLVDTLPGLRCFLLLECDEGKNETLLISFWLEKVVFPNETNQFRQRRVSSAWNLSASKIAIGFSGTDDNQDLLPPSIKQIAQLDDELLATNGRMLDLILTCTRTVDVINTTVLYDDQQPLGKVVIDTAFQKGASAHRSQNL